MPNSEEVPDAGLEEQVLNASRIMLNILAESLLQEGESQITIPQFRVLDMIHSLTDKPARIAHMLGITPSAVTSLLERLEEGGYILRRQGSEDRRRVVLALTPRGEDLVRRVNARRRKRLESILRHTSQETRLRLEEALREFSAAYFRSRKKGQR